jgi:hypothetical protein
VEDQAVPPKQPQPPQPPERHVVRQRTAAREHDRTMKRPGAVNALKHQPQAGKKAGSREEEFRR